MSQRVPRWDLDGDAPATSRHPLRSPDTSASAADIPQLDYEVTELTWENGQLALHGLGPPRVPARQQPLPATSQSSPANYAWDNHKPRGSGTLESIVNPTAYGHKLVPWFDHHNGAVAMDGLVPCPSVGRPETEQRSISVRNAGYTPVGSCRGPVRGDEENFLAAKRARMTAAAAGKWSGMDQISVSGSARDDESRRVTFGTYDTTSLGSPEKTKTTAGDDCDDSVCHYKPKREVDDEEDKKKVGNSSASTKRRRAAAIHNQSERKRRDKINQRMETLQKLVPNSSKADKASMLDEVIEYLNQLQAQVNMMSRMNMSSMMLPMAMQQQQQLQMSMMAMQQQIQMSGMGMMDMNIMNTMNTMNRPATNMMPNPFMPMAAAASSWDNVSNENPMAAFLSCQSQPMTMDAYTQMAALYQQLQQQQQPVSSRKS